MRRSEKEITDIREIEEIILESDVCRIGLSDDGQPYVVPVNFGYENMTLYIHAALEGRKIDIIRKNNNVCVVFDIDHEFLKTDKVCKWSTSYRSVMAFGKAYLVDDPDEKRHGLDVLVSHYGGHPEDYAEKTLAKTAIMKIDIESVTGKVSGNKINS
jgi:nitroimidazol reductase NimA-like FMN-containing flavoprotein (pyridoxamine 5'-phosphate oxidase superfamily)